MNRIIKFRGISVITNEWVYGSLICDSYDPAVKNEEGFLRIVTSSGPYEYEWAVVKNDSIGQLTGIETNHGNEIYEGDILSGADSEGYGPEAIHYNIKSVVSWDISQGKWIVTEIGDSQKYDLYDYSLADYVIGNIHFNLELCVS